MTSILDDAPVSTPAVDHAAEYKLADFVGEGKKYKDESAYVRSRLEADAHIARIEREKAALLEDLKASQTAKRMEEMLDQLSSLQREPPAPSNVEPPREKTVEKGLSLEDVEKVIAQRDAQKAQEANKKIVLDRLVSEFGDNYLSKVKEYAQQLSVGVEFLDSVAVQNPTAFFKLLGLEDKKVTLTKADDQGFAPPRSRENVNFQPQSNVKNWKYYEHMRKTDPVKYHSTSTQWEMDREAIRQAERFYD